MGVSRDIHSLSEFKRNTAKFITRMKRSRHPVVLTINGRAALVVQDASSYQRLLQLAERAEMTEFLKKSRADIEEVRTVAAREALGRLAKKYKLKAQGK